MTIDGDRNFAQRSQRAEERLRELTGQIEPYIERADGRIDGAVTRDMLAVTLGYIAFDYIRQRVGEDTANFAQALEESLDRAAAHGALHCEVLSMGMRMGYALALRHQDETGRA